MRFLPRSPGTVTFKAAAPPQSAPSTLTGTAQQQAEYIEFVLALLPKRFESVFTQITLGSSTTSGLHSPFRSSLWRLRLALPCALGLGPNASDFAAALTLSHASGFDARGALGYSVCSGSGLHSRLQVRKFCDSSNYFDCMRKEEGLFGIAHPRHTASSSSISNSSQAVSSN